MAKVEITRDARCDDCAFFKRIKVGKRAAHRCVVDKKPGAPALEQDPVARLRDKACRKFRPTWLDT